ncbi:glutamic acid-rich protein-like [Mytilus trossulus]|uniref:glutamic acid-rich protein-like n=1 Tax=Mytilus trossulus TaxID=6551 RepID=UPI0030054CE2
MESVGKRKRLIPIKEDIEDKIPRKKPREYAQEYRDRIKRNTEIYKLHRHNETIRIKEYREKGQTEEAKQRNRDLQRARQQKYRERLKDLGKTNPEKPKTRHAQEMQRRKWREDRQKHRLCMSTQKKTATNSKRREKKKKKKPKHCNFDCRNKTSKTSRGNINKCIQNSKVP